MLSDVFIGGHDFGFTGAKGGKYMIGYNMMHYNRQHAAKTLMSCFRQVDPTVSPLSSSNSINVGNTKSSIAHIRSDFSRIRSGTT